MPSQHIYAVALVSFGLAAASSPASAGMPLICDDAAIKPAALNLFRHSPLNFAPGGPIADWEGYVRMTYLDDQGRYVTVFYDPDWQPRVQRIDCWHQARP